MNADAAPAATAALSAGARRPRPFLATGFPVSFRARLAEFTAADRPRPSTKPSSLGPRPASARCVSITVPSLISASAAAVECGHRRGPARMVPSFTCQIPTGCTASNSRRPWMCSRKGSVRTASRSTGSPPKTRVLTQSQSGSGKRIYTSHRSKTSSGPRSRSLAPGATPWSERHADLLTDKDRPVVAVIPADRPG
jgi:hypothetical protein